MINNAGRIRVNVTGARGAIGLDIQGTPSAGKFVAFGANPREVFPSDGTGADAGLRTDLGTAANGGSSLVSYRYDGASVEQTQTEVVRRAPLNLYDKIPRNLWAGIEAGSNTTDLTPYIVSAIGTGRQISARKGRYRCKLNLTSGNGISIRGEGKQLTYFENVDNTPIVTLDSSSAHIVGFEMEDLWLENRNPGTFNTCDLFKITGSGDGSQWQNDSHHFRNVWFFQGRDNFACYLRSIWNVFDGCNFTGAIRDGIHVETIGNVNQWELKGRTILKGNGRNGLFFKHDGVDLATGWVFDNISTEDSGYEGWRITGSFGIQAWSVRASTWENNARLLTTGSSSAIEGIRRRKANIHVDSNYLAGFDLNALTMYNNEAGGTGGNPDYHIYVSAFGPDGGAVAAQSGSIANSRFLPVQSGGNDVVWPIGLTYHANNFNNPATPVLMDEQRGSIDLRKFTPQDQIVATLTLTGVGTPQVGTARYTKQGSQVTAYIPTMTGTSNSTSATLVGLPQALWPTRDQTVAIRVQDGNLGIVLATCTIMPNGVITLFKDAGGGAFVDSGTKGVHLSTITWSLL